MRSRMNGRLKKRGVGLCCGLSVALTMECRVMCEGKHEFGVWFGWVSLRKKWYLIRIVRSGLGLIWYVTEKRKKQKEKHNNNRSHAQAQTRVTTNTSKGKGTYFVILCVSHLYVSMMIIHNES